MIEDFIKKIAVKFDSTDFYIIRSKEGFIQTLKFWGCSNEWLDEINDENWEKYRQIVYDICL